MDSNTAIGQVDKYILKTTDALGDEYETTINKSFTINSQATYGQVDAAGRAIVAITKNTYQDTILVTNISVNEVIAE